MYISAVFGIIAECIPIQSHTWYMWAKLAVFTTASPKSVGVMAFGRVVVTALYPNGRTVWVVKAVYHDDWCKYNKFHAYCPFLVVMAAWLNAKL